jgi:threonine/homoserine/homoserine lactone efflux protein
MSNCDGGINYQPGFTGLFGSIIKTAERKIQPVGKCRQKNTNSKGTFIFYKFVSVKQNNMLGVENIGSFILAAIIVVITPGIDTIMVLTRSVSKGKMAGLYSALGVSTGLIFHTLAVTFGLSVIVATSAMAFSIIKYAGAGYLIYIGIKALISKSQQEIITPTDIKIGGGKKMFFTAFISDVLNPKIAIFFLAFLPQFIKTSEINNPVPYLLLGAIMFLVTLIWCSFLALTGSKVAILFNSNKNAEKWMNKTSGLVFILLGVKVAFTKK